MWLCDQVEGKIEFEACDGDGWSLFAKHYYGVSVGEVVTEFWKTKFRYHEQPDTEVTLKFDEEEEENGEEDEV